MTVSSPPLPVDDDGPHSMRRRRRRRPLRLCVTLWLLVAVCAAVCAALATTGAVAHVAVAASDDPHAAAVDTAATLAAKAAAAKAAAAKAAATADAAEKKPQQTPSDTTKHGEQDHDNADNDAEHLTRPHVSVVRQVMWCGGVSDTEAQIRLRGHIGRQFRVTTRNPSDDIPAAVAATLYAVHISHRLSKIHLTALTPDTRFWYGFFDPDDNNGRVPMIDSDIDVGTFRTAPADGTPASFQFVFASCSNNADAPVYDRILDAHAGSAAFMVQMGDLYYGDIVTDQHHEYDNWWHHTLTGKFGVLARNIPMAYMWDDHDYGNNDSGAEAPTRADALAAYTRNVPHYPLVTNNGTGYRTTETDRRSHAVYQAWTRGRVRFIMTDLRSENHVGRPGIMSDTQLAWLFSEFAAFKDYGMLVWVSTVPWIGAADSENERDNWAGHAAMRTQVSNYIAEHGVHNLVVVSGDAHMIAIDDGTNTDYSTVDGAAGFPLMQAAPLRHVGSSKGGPFSEGCVGYQLYTSEQYAWMDIEDAGGDAPVCFSWHGYRIGWGGIRGEVMTHRACAPFVKAGKAGGGQGHCRIALWPPWVWVVVGMWAALTLAVWLCCYKLRVLTRRTRVLTSAVLLPLVWTACFVVPYVDRKHPWPERLWTTFAAAAVLTAGVLVALLLSARYHTALVRRVRLQKRAAVRVCPRLCGCWLTMWARCPGGRPGDSDALDTLLQRTRRELSDDDDDEPAHVDGEGVVNVIDHSTVFDAAAAAGGIQHPDGNVDVSHLYPVPQSSPVAVDKPKRKKKKANTHARNQSHDIDLARTLHTRAHSREIEMNAVVPTNEK